MLRLQRTSTNGGLSHKEDIYIMLLPQGLGTIHPRRGVGKNVRTRDKGVLGQTEYSGSDRTTVLMISQQLLLAAHD